MHNYLAGQKRTKLRNAALAGGRFLVSFKRALGVCGQINCTERSTALLCGHRDGLNDLYGEHYIN